MVADGGSGVDHDARGRTRPAIDRSASARCSDGIYGPRRCGRTAATVGVAGCGRQRRTPSDGETADRPSAPAMLAFEAAALARP